MTYQIVIGWTEESQEIVKFGRADLGESHKFKTIQKPFSCIWLNKGRENDIQKAQSFAKSENKMVFVYQGEKNPLQRAKDDALKASNA